MFRCRGGISDQLLRCLEGVDVLKLWDENEGLRPRISQAGILTAVPENQRVAAVSRNFQLSVPFVVYFSHQQETWHWPAADCAPPKEMRMSR